jgi:hypothetical protein
MERFRNRTPSPAIVVALLALVMASTGSAVAASLITSKQIKDGTIQTRDISRKALASLRTTAAVAPAPAPTGPAGPQGATGAKGDKGDKGDTGDQGLRGPTGPSDGYSVGNASDSGSTGPLALNLPAGDYIAFGKYSVFWPTASSGSALCSMSDGAGHMASLFSSVAQGGVTLNSASGSILVHLASAGKVTMDCTVSNATIGYANMTAIKVGTLH